MEVTGTNPPTTNHDQHHKTRVLAILQRKRNTKRSSASTMQSLTQHTDRVNTDEKQHIVSSSHTTHVLCWLACPKGVSVVDGGGETPGPIPNPEAKPARADGTALGRVWESRLPPTQQLQNRQTPRLIRFTPDTRRGVFVMCMLSPGGTGIVVQPARITPVLCLVAENPLQHHSTTPQDHRAWDALPCPGGRHSPGGTGIIM